MTDSNQDVNNQLFDLRARPGGVGRKLRLTSKPSEVWRQFHLCRQARTDPRWLPGSGNVPPLGPEKKLAFERELRRTQTGAESDVFLCPSFLSQSLEMRPITQSN